MEEQMKRRNFLKNTAAVTAGAAIAPYVMKGQKLYDVVPNEKILGAADDNITIIIEMFGGNDGLNTIPPYHQEDEYMKLRPELNIPKNKAQRFGSSDLYMHPALIENSHKNGMMRLMDEGKLAIIQGIGYENANLSHFRSQEIWLSGINSSDPKEKLLSGWLGRYFAEKLTDFPNVIPDHPLAVQIGTNLSLLMKSPKGHMGIVLNDIEKFYTLGLGLTPNAPLFDNPLSNYYQKEFNFAHLVARQSEMYALAVKNAYESGKSKLKVQYSDGLAEKFRLISALIAGGLKSNVYFVNVSNFDSHAQQANQDYTGQHAVLLNQVSNAISQFLDDAAQIGFAERIAGFTMSEFGRRAYENGSRGTDHGAGSMQFVFAGSDKFIKGGLYSEPGKPNLFDLDEYGNIKHDYDFRRTYVDFLETWLGAEKKDIETVFGKYYFPLEVLKQRSSSVDMSIKPIDGKYLIVTPNPSNSKSNAKFELRDSAIVKLEVFSLAGELKSSTKYTLDAGIYNFNLGEFQSGTYICSLTINGVRYFEKFVVSK